MTNKIKSQKQQKNNKERNRPNTSAISNWGKKHSDLNIWKRSSCVSLTPGTAWGNFWVGIGARAVLKAENGLETPALQF